MRLIAQKTSVCGSLVLFVWLVLACSKRAPEPTPAAEAGRVVQYSFGSLEGDLIGSFQMRGRVTALLFVTTFDLGSQVQAKLLQDALRRHEPRINAIAVVLEPPKNAELARSFEQVLGLSYHVVMADPATLAGRGPFGKVQTVPTWVILDARSRLSAVARGALSLDEIEQLLEQAQR